jgi:hypothetical protein
VPGAQSGKTAVGFQVVFFRDGFGIAERLGNHVAVSVHSYRGGLIQRHPEGASQAPPGISLVRVDREKRAGSKNNRKNEALQTILAGDEKP